MEEETKPVEAVTVPEAPVQPQPVPVLPPRSKLPLIAILLVAILLIAVGGIYAVKRLSQPKACTLEVKLCPDGSSVGRTGPNCEFDPCPTKISSATPTPSETANWKTYTNSKYGFSFKYPSEYKYKENNYPKEANGIYSYTQIILADAKAFSPEPIGQPYIMLSIIDSTDHKNDSVYNNSTSIGSMSVAGIQADVRQDAQGGEVVVFIKGSNTYEFNLTNYAKDVTLKNKLNQILSTFKFLD